MGQGCDKVNSMDIQVRSLVTQHMKQKFFEPSEPILFESNVIRINNLDKERRSILVLTAEGVYLFTQD